MKICKRGSMSKKKVLLLNPPTIGNRPIIKDQYCSNTSKAGYYWIPVDLLVLSGDLAHHFDVKVLDSIIEKKSKSETIDQIIEFAPEHIVVLSSVLTHFEDRALIQLLRTNLQFKTTFIGDIFYFSSEKMIQFEEVDSIIYEYPSPQLVDYISKGEASSNLIYKIRGKVISLPKVKEIDVNYRTPRHDLFPIQKYSVPFMMDEKCTSVLTNFGCKFTCNYCPASSVSYRQRSTDNIMEELRTLQNLKITNIWIRDFTFALNKGRTIELLKAMIPLKLNWFCLSRAEVIEEDFLSLMKESGCYLLMMGVDTINEKSMKKIKRWQSVKELKDKIKLIEENRISVLAHMIIGLPGDTMRDILKTVHFLCSSKASYLSINLFAPRTGSAYFDELNIELQESRRLDSYYGDQQTKKQRMLYLLIKYYGMILFYCNPFRLLNIIRRVTTITQLKVLIRTGMRMFFPVSKG